MVIGMRVLTKINCVQYFFTAENILVRFKMKKNYKVMVYRHALHAMDSFLKIEKLQLLVGETVLLTKLYFLPNLPLRYFLYIEEINFEQKKFCKTA